MTDHNGTPLPPSGEPARPASYPNAPAAPNAYSTAGTPGEDPGKTLGIVGLVLAFVFSLAGLIVSIIANNKSKRAGFKNTPAKVGIILSIVFLVLGIILAIVLIAVTGAVVNDVLEQCAGLDSGVYETQDGTQITCP